MIHSNMTLFIFRFVYVTSWHHVTSCDGVYISLVYVHYIMVVVRIKTKHCIKIRQYTPFLKIDFLNGGVMSL